MKLFGFNVPFTGDKTPPIHEILNIDMSQPKSANIQTKIVTRQLHRQKQDISNWRSATSSAESKLNPSRTELYRIYKDVVLDPHLSGLWQTIKNNIFSNRFFLQDATNGIIDKEETKKMNKRWFREFMTLVIDSMFYGTTLVQLGDVVDDKFDSIKLIPRENVVPELGVVLEEIYGARTGEGATEYRKGQYKKWVLELGKEDDLGILHKATPLVLWKKNVMIAWNQYAELFGMPTRMGKTETRDPNRTQNMQNMLSEMGGAGWGIFDKDDELEFVAANDEDAYQVFQNLIELINKEISKLVTGQTMTSEDGSSRSQAEVHERVLEAFITNAKWEIKDYVNEKLIPLMVEKGMLPDGLVFEFDNSEKLSLKDQFFVVQGIINTGRYKVPTEYMTDTFGIPLEEIEQEEVEKDEEDPDKSTDGSGGMVDPETNAGK